MTSPKRLSWPLITIAFLILAIFTGSALWIYFLSPGKFSSPSFLFRPPPQSKLFKIVKIDDFSDSYVVSDPYGFTLTISKDLISKGLEVKERGDGFIGLYLAGGTRDTIRGSEFGEGIHMILKAEDLNSRTLEQIVIGSHKGSKSISDTSDIKKIKINYLYGYSFEGVGIKKTNYIYLPIDNKRYLEITDMTGTTDSTDQEFKALANSIISSIYIHPPDPSSVPSPDTSTWKTYQNPNTPYTFQYPANFSLKDGKVVYLRLEGPSQRKGSELFEDGIFLFFEPPISIENKDLSQYTDKAIVISGNVNQILKPKSKITINNLEGYTYTLDHGGVDQRIFLQSPTTQKVVEINNYTVDPYAQGYQQTVNQILSTFKFISSQSPAPTPTSAYNIPSTYDTSNWKTYRNEKYKFVFKYPEDWRFEAIPSYNAAGERFLFTDQNLNRIIVDPLGIDKPSPTTDNLIQTKIIKVGNTTAQWREFGNAGGVWFILVDESSNNVYPNFYINITPVNAKNYLDSNKMPEFNQILSTLQFAK